MTIVTKFGEFNVETNGENGTCLFMEGAKIAEFPKVSWWDKDAIEKGLDDNAELVEQRIAERVGKKVNMVTRENVTETLEEVLKVLGKEKNDFYSSRLKQCINKLKSA